MRNSSHLRLITRCLSLMALLGLLLACQSVRPPQAAAPWPETPTAVIASPEDERDYASFELPNGLRVLVISDPEAEKAAVSLDVMTGSKDDPPGREGLAHFLEHMLFLGTEKYPVAGEYQSFIAEHGGQHNAYTSFDNTNYFFDINAADLEPALDRFSQFFISPLFTAAYVDREKNAVESEYRAKLKDEGRRGLDAFKEIVNPEHPFAKFSVGSLDTLADREGSLVRDDLLAFYDAHYSANVMHLVVLGPDSVAELTALVKKLFSAVPDRELAPPPITVPLFAPGTLPAQLTVTPEQNIRRLELNFPVPDTVEDWRAKPFHVIADILGNEGPGSLLQYLKQRGWAESLSAGQGLSYRHGATLNVTVALTEAGYLARDQVVTAIFQLINRIADSDISEQRFAEQRQIAELRFRYQDKPENIHYVMALASSMALYPPDMMLRGPFEFSDYQPQLYRELLAKLQPDNLFLTVVGPDLATDRTSRLYQTPYALTPLRPDQLAAWERAGLNPAITLPGANPFIPEQLARLASPYSDATPVLLERDRGIQLWHGDDATFTTPRASVRLALMSPLADDSARHRVLLELWAAMAGDNLNPKLYPALLAGLNASIRGERQGLVLAIDGFSDKQDRLLALMAEEIAAAPLDPQRFADIKQAAVRSWENARRRPPYTYLPGVLRELMMRPRWSDEDKLAAVASVQLADLSRYRTAFLSRLRARVLVYGNRSVTESRAMLQALQPLLSGASAELELPGVGVVALSADERWRYEVALPHDDAAMAYYVQGEGEGNVPRVLMGLTGQIIGTPYYHSLRTEQQFGYVVYAAPTVLERTPGLTFIVQSPVADITTLVDASNRLLKGFNTEAQAMSEATFERHKTALASQINRPHQSLVQATGYLWDQLTQGYTRFDRREQLTAALVSLSLAQWQSFYADQFAHPPGRALLVYHTGRRGLSPGGLTSFEPILTRQGFQDRHSVRQYP